MAYGLTSSVNATVQLREAAPRHHRRRHRGRTEPAVYSQASLVLRPGLY